MFDRVASLLLNDPSLSDWRSAAPLGVLALLSGVAALLFWRSSTVAKDAEARLASRRNALVFLLSMGVFAFAAGVLLAAAENRRSLWLLSALPAVLILAQGVFLHLARKRVVPEDDRTSRDAVGSIVGPPPADLLRVLRMISRSRDKYFGTDALVIRYFVPAVLVLALNLKIGNELLDLREGAPKLTPVLTLVPPEATVGITYGLLGAYVYVLLYLGKRAFRLDITPGAATWCVVTLAVGPVLAGVLNLFLHAKDSSGDLGPRSILFVTGFSPRMVADFIESYVRRTYLGANSVTSRSVPLGQVRGMCAEVIERLQEEGVLDAHALANADPIRLIRNTNFDKRQIVDWIDSAVLVTTLPEAAQALERAGITGAMDLASYATGGDRGASSRTLSELASATGVSEIVLRQTSERLMDDGQVRLLWVLYEFEQSNDPEPTVAPAE